MTRRLLLKCAPNGKTTKLNPEKTTYLEFAEDGAFQERVFGPNDKTVTKEYGEQRSFGDCVGVGGKVSPNCN